VVSPSLTTEHDEPEEPEGKKGFLDGAEHQGKDKGTRLNVPDLDRRGIALDDRLDRGEYRARFQGRGHIE
jgi:hypothetical protein